MIFIYDHLIAIIVGTVIVLMLINVQQRSQQVNVERTMAYIAKKQILDLADVMERDLANFGYGTGPGEEGATKFSQNADGITDTLDYWGTDALGNQVEIRYVTEAKDTVVVQGEDKKLWELKRYEKVGGAWTQRGGSTPTLTFFSIDPLDEGNNIIDIGNARRLRVRISNAVLPSMAKDQNDETSRSLYRELNWGITLSPSNIRGFQGE